MTYFFRLGVQQALVKLAVSNPILKQQTEHTCGPAALRMALQRLASEVPSESQLAKELRTTKKDGTSPQALISAARKRGCNVVVRERTKIPELKNLLKQGPVLVSFQAWPTKPGLDLSKTKREGHYAIVDKVTNSSVHLSDPGTNKKRILPLQDFQKRWHDADGGKIFRQLAIRIRRKQDG